MKLITRYELAAYNKYQLHALFKYTFDELIKSTPDSHERRNALASLENIQRELSNRYPF